jgi:hypothetical protein
MVESCDTLYSATSCVALLGCSWESGIWYGGTCSGTPIATQLLWQSTTMLVAVCGLLAVFFLGGIFASVRPIAEDSHRLPHSDEKDDDCWQRELRAEKLLAELRLREKAAREEAAQRKRQWAAMADTIDVFIRTRTGFNSEKPQQYACEISTLRRECHHQAWTCVSEVCRERFTLHGPRSWSVSVRHLTPFQGESSHRVFGNFLCACGRKWQSAATWTDKWQKCKSCERHVYPYRQHSLEHARQEAHDQDKNKRPHDMARCQKCRERGSLCVPHMFYAT